MLAVSSATPPKTKSYDQPLYSEAPGRALQGPAFFVCPMEILSGEILDPNIL